MAGTWRTVLLRGGAALVVLALPAGVVLGGDRVVAWEPTAQPSVAVPVASPATDLVCPSPVRLATASSATPDQAVDPQFDPVPVASVATLTAMSAGDGSSAASAQIRALGSTDTLVPLPGSPLTSVVTETQPPTAAVIHAAGGQDRSVALAGSVVTQTSAGDLRGLVASACRPAAVQTWLVGGSTSVETSARLVLQNPGRTPATVSIAVWGSTGPVDLAATPDILVPPGVERSVLLEGLAVEQPRIVVRVTSSGGAVSAYLQDSALNGLVPAGVSDVVGGQEPSLRQVVPGVALAGGDGDPAVLRLLVPGTEAGTARVSLLGPDGSTVLPGADALGLEAGAVLDVPLGGLAAGTYSIVVDSDVPVVAGAMVARGTALGLDPSLITTPVDRAWVPSMPAGAGGLVALPGLPGWSVNLAVPQGTGASTAVVSVQAVGGDGAVLGTVTRTVDPGRSLTVRADQIAPLGAPATGLVVRTEGEGPSSLAWAVVLEVPQKTGGLVAVLGPVAVATARASVEVRLH